MLIEKKDCLIDYQLGVKIDKSILIESRQYYYLVCTVDKFPGILKNGIEADDEGYIYLFSIQRLASYIARKFYPDIEDFAVFRIKKQGVTGESEFYDINNPLMYYNFRIKQGLLKHEDIILIDCYIFSKKRPKIHKTKDYSMFKFLDKSPEKKKPTKH